MQKTRGESQEKIYNYVKQYIADTGYPPSVREICDAVGLKSTSTVHGHLTRLEKKGLIQRAALKPRAIDVTNRNHNISPAIPLPVVGTVAAGIPITAIENVSEHIAVPSELAGSGEHFVLVVKGDSMIDAGIYEGDYLVVRKQATANNGEIVVAMIEDEATVKRFYKEKDHIKLVAENENYAPIVARNVEVLGKVQGLMRSI